jgi:4-hydroxyphenylpyruvate dioxygenase
MPDRIAVVGVEFIEFAASETEADELAAMLETMGFALAARHINKEVVLYRQGEINVVLNTEKEGMAFSSYIAHGANAYAIGLRVEDARATVERAKALGAEPFEQRHGPGELTIPAIRGVAGGVIYFIDESSELGRVWDVEFERAAAAAPSAAGLTKLDHVAQTMNYEEMLTWLLFYTAIFRTKKAPLVDIVDPGGLVRSQAIESPGGAFRLTLNGAESRKTLAGHFVAESFGSSVQHVAFATADIFATA